MRSSALEAELDVRVTNVVVTDDTLTVELEDGRTISSPLVWYPRLAHGSAEERADFKIGAFGIHWPLLDEDLSTRGIILGHKSGESAESLKFWLENREKGRRVTLEDFLNSRRKPKAPKSRANSKRQLRKGPNA
jgi:hypothetical protein